ncbi:hypothetical protein CDV55_107019 [Aspergillus turcosus]|uniref:Aminoglycoside phosphotransferase domain-containing protein n=1 Tax=Aspergillus turcosus TaxID=1245748 RepID=A0A229X9A2_9EURO|nr:hypothetical protein CDV55_107019 [Aspergillus turcosus]RLL97844.1 hypothetical protein CFD26_101229 [Aspergillus turcosus]
MEGQLADADTSPVLRGWRQDGLRTRIDRFLDEGLGAVLSDCSIDLDRLAFIYGDLTSSNILFDPEANQLTTLLDFDFAFISHPAHEFFISLSDVGGNTSVSDSRITAAILSGNFDVKLGTELASGDKDADNTVQLLSRAQTWDAALRAAGGMRPSEIAGVVTLNKLRQLEGLLCPPFQLVHPVIVKRKTPEELEQGREKVAESLARELEHFGF